MSRLEREFQRLPKAILRTQLHGLISRYTMLISFTGRKSGKRYTRPVNYVRDGDEVVLTASHPWWKNLRGKRGVGVPVGLCIKGRNYTGFAEVETDEEAVLRAVEKILGEQPGYGKRIGAKPGPEGGVEPDQAAEAIRDGLVAVRVKGVEPLRT